MLSTAISYGFYILCGAMILAAGILALRASERLAGILLTLGGVGFIYRQLLGIAFDYVTFVDPGSHVIKALLGLRGADGIVIPAYILSFSIGALILARRHLQGSASRRN